MGTLAAPSTTPNGGWTDLGRKRVSFDVRGEEPEVLTRPVVVTSGQVLKRGTFLQSGTAGKVVAHAPLTEIASVAFDDITNGETIVLAGLTWTAGSDGTTAEELAIAWAGIAAATGYAALAARDGGGSFTAGTLTGYNTVAKNATTVEFVGDTVANLTDVSTGASTGTATVTAIAYATMAPVVGMLAMDVDATDGDVDAQAFIQGNFWDTFPVWWVDTTVDTVVGADGVAVACTAYDTGCRTELMYQKFLEYCAGNVDIVVGSFNPGEVEI
jgi:hypothetical protein